MHHPASVTPLLDLSTLHLLPATLFRLAQLAVQAPAAREGRPVITISPFPRGVFFTVPADDAGSDAVPEDLRRLLALARSVGASAVRIDADGPHDPALPTYDAEWEAPLTSDPSTDYIWPVLLTRDVVQDAVGLLDVLEDDFADGEAPAVRAGMRAAMEGQTP